MTSSKYKKNFQDFFFKKNFYSKNFFVIHSLKNKTNTKAFFVSKNFFCVFVLMNISLDLVCFCAYVPVVLKNDKKSLIFREIPNNRDFFFWHSQKTKQIKWFIQQNKITKKFFCFKKFFLCFVFDEYITFFLFFVCLCPCRFEKRWKNIVFLKRHWHFENFFV